MQILTQNSGRRTPAVSNSRPQTQPQATPRAVSQSPHEDSVFLKGLNTASDFAAPASGIVGAGAAAYFASPLLHLGQGSLSKTFVGAGVGAGVGLAIGAGTAHLYKKFSHDASGEQEVMGAALTLGGAAAGGVVGLVGGIFGANPFVTVPAALIGGGAAAAVVGFAASKMNHGSC